MSGMSAEGRVMKSKKGRKKERCVRGEERGKKEDTRSMTVVSDDSSFGAGLTCE